MIMLVGLITKNGILVVEFANQRHIAGLDKRSAALEAAKAGTFVIWSDPDRQPGVSDTAKQLFGFSADETPSVGDFLSRIHPDDAASVEQQIITSMERLEGHYIEYRVIRPDESIVHIASRAEAELLADGQTIRMRGAIIDVSASKAAEAE
ncbi:MAG: PAS domain-containing protein, partial [Verrucomicrobiota bacterium]